MFGLADRMRLAANFLDSPIPYASFRDRSCPRQDKRGLLKSVALHLCVHEEPSVKTPSVLLLTCMISICALGQASNMISISTLEKESAVATSYTRADVKRLVKTAQTADEFERLADYFDRQAEDFAAKYEAEQKELDRLLALRYHARSYPAQLEGTRNRMDNFKALSHKCSGQAALYRARTKAADTSGTVGSAPQ